MTKHRLLTFSVLTALTLTLANCGQRATDSNVDLAEGEMQTSEFGTDSVASADPIGKSTSDSAETKLGGQSSSIPGLGVPGANTEFAGLVPKNQPSGDMSTWDLLGKPTGYQYGNLIPNITQLIPYLDPANKRYFPNPELINYYYCSIETMLGYEASRKAALVEAYYLDVLGRLPDPDGFVFWIKQLSSETNPYYREQVAKGIQRSRENYNRIVNALYETVLERRKTPGDGDYYLNRFLQGASLEQVTAEMHASQENWVRRFKRNSRLFVRDSLYRKILGRGRTKANGKTYTDSQPWEITYWVQRSGNLNVLQNRINLALNILNSFEARQKFVETMYGKYLGRASDPVGLQAWTNQMMSGGLLRFDVEAKFLASDEYFDKSALKRFLSLNAPKFCDDL